MSGDSVDTRYADSLPDALRELLDLRDRGFWSFRGQRDHQWHLGLHHAPDVTEQRLRDRFSHFRRRCMEFGEPAFISETSHWRWLFHAQHYRLQTWLLDWTSSPLVALYFAVENIHSAQHLERKPFGAVWCLSVDGEDFRDERSLPAHPVDVDRWIMVNPPPITSRIRRQSAKFSFHPHQDNRLLDVRERRNSNERLVKLIIGKKEVVENSPGGADDNPAETIRKQLGIMNCHHGSLFPDPEGVALFVNYQLPDIHRDSDSRNGFGVTEVM